MKLLVYLLLCSFLTISCIPISVAPKIKDYKLKTARKFKRGLPNEKSFIFSDPKDAHAFYNFFLRKFNLDFDYEGWSAPFDLDGKKYYLTYYEAERVTRTINLLPITANLALENQGMDPLFDQEFSRIGNWYLIFTVNDEAFNDCLSNNYPHRERIIAYLKQLKNEYLANQNWNEVLLKP